VVDEEGNPVAGVLITIGTNFGTTDADGVVTLKLEKGEYTATIGAPEGYYADWFSKPQFWIGAAIFVAGMVINLHSDYIIRNLRKPGDKRHYIPKGGMFRYVSSANYFGEFTEWVGFATASWSWAGVVFALWTFANLAPRSASLYKRYEQEFGEEFTSLKRKRIIPFIY
jgi:3-oxo-5-alpha-steroid 4-dehydrogenase 1